jgi:hypothetical protein
MGGGRSIVWKKRKSRSDAEPSIEVGRGVGFSPAQEDGSL